MILFTILALTVILLTVIVVTVTSVIGAGAIIIFGDVIICIVILAWLIKKLFFNKK